MGEPRDIFILEDPHSNRALVRTDAEIYPDDIDGRPGKGWLRFIEYSAYDHVCKELNKWIAGFNEKHDQIESLQSRLSIAEAALKKFTSHRDKCDREWVKEELCECSCGAQIAIEALAKIRGKDE